MVKHFRQLTSKQYSTKACKRLRHRKTGRTAIGYKVADGLIMVQFDNRKLPQAYGWHLYPHKNFKPCKRATIRSKNNETL